jgi:Ca2+/Na+ antiporter
VPIALVALVATATGHSSIAVGVVFSTSVAALSLYMGVIVLSADEHELAPPTSNARVWSFVLPAAVLALVAGFSGQLTRLHAIMLAVQGAMILMVWSERGGGGEAAPQPVEPLDVTDSPTASRMTLVRAIEFVLAAGLAALGAWAAVLGTGRMSYETRIMSPGLIAATTIGPLLILPMIGGGSVLIRRGQTQAALSASVIVPLLNLCLLLPVIVGLWYVRPHVAEFVQRLREPVAEASATTSPIEPPTTAPAPVPPMSYPIAVWRLDTVMLIVLGLFILPIGLRRWTLGRREGAALILGYAVYLVLTTTLGRRW